MDSEKYAKFDVSDLTYKVVNGQDIKAYVLTPKGIALGKHPLVAKFHGDHGLLNQPRLVAPVGALDYCILHSAIIVTGDYRLIPESTGMDIHEDVCSFWDWVRSDLNTYLAGARPGLEADLTKVLVHGVDVERTPANSAQESVGGTLAMLSGFNQPPGFIKAIIAMYPGIRHTPKRTKPLMGAPTVPPTVLAAHLAGMIPGKIVTSAFPPARMDIALSIMQQKVITQYWDDDERMNLIALLEKADDVPYTVILHGEEDTMVPVDGSLEWAQLVKKKFGDKAGEKFDVHFEPGEEHGFDGHFPLDIPWLQEKLKKVTELWLGGGFRLPSRR